jgi:hypothetical protein
MGFRRRRTVWLADCLRYCVKQGTKYALVVGKSVYTLEGHESKPDKYAARKVTVKGTVKGETHDGRICGSRRPTPWRT